MIDWLTIVAPLQHVIGPGGPFDAGQVLSFTPDATLPNGQREEWRILKRLPLEGSYSNSILVRSTLARPGGVLAPGTPALWISGNPAKWFQGHNIFGSEDLRGLAQEMLVGICRARGVIPSAQDLEYWKLGLIDVHRADVTYSYAMRDLAQARSCIHALDSSAHMRFRGRGQFKGDSIIFGHGSRRSSLMFYCKGSEIELPKHKLPTELNATQLPRYAAGLLRSEARVRTMDLKPHGLHIAANWGDNSAAELHRHFIDALDIAESTMIEAQTLEGLPGRLQLAYSAWKQGHDLRATLARNTFYRYRSELLAHGIDIAVKQDRAPQQPAVSLRLVVTAQPEAVPAWAVGTPLYYEPRARAA